MRRFIHRPSPALAVALLALFIALGSTGVAAIRPAKPHNATAQAANKQKGSRGFRGFRGFRGPRGFNGPAGATGPAGPAGPAGSALAYAHVTGGALDAANSKNVTLTGLSTGGTSTCLAVSGQPHTVVAMIDNSGADPRFTSVAGTVTPSAITSSGCPAGSNVLITTVNSASGAALFTPVPFYATFN